MKILITGATGFIGSNITKKLVKAGYETNILIRKNSDLLNIKDLPVNIFYGDLTDFSSLKNSLKNCSALIHCAAFYSFWSRDPALFYNINVEGTKNILKAAFEAGVEKVVYTSSESTLNISKIPPEDSKALELNDLNNVAGDYKKSKILAEIEVLKMIEKGFPITIINPTTPIGPGDIKPTPTGRIVLDFINNKMPVYVNTGLNIIDVQDLADAHISAMQKDKNGKRYIVGNKNLTLKEIFEILEKITGILAPKREIPLRLIKPFAYMDEFVSGKILKKYPRIPVAAVQTACKKRFFNCIRDTEELGIKLTPVENTFGKAVSWFRDNGYVRNYIKN
ncbi:MAG: hopanoid-associated sugar epimerase [Candidatus Humimicrobiaceae bacterium]